MCVCVRVCTRVTAHTHNSAAHTRRRGVGDNRTIELRRDEERLPTAKLAKMGRAGALFPNPLGVCECEVLSLFCWLPGGSECSPLFGVPRSRLCIPVPPRGAVKGEEAGASPSRSVVCASFCRTHRRVSFCGGTAAGGRSRKRGGSELSLSLASLHTADTCAQCRRRLSQLYGAAPPPTHTPHLPLPASALKYWHDDIEFQLSLLFLF